MVVTKYMNVQMKYIDLTFDLQDYKNNISNLNPKCNKELFFVP